MAAGLSAAVGLGVTACSRDYTSDYVYTVSAANGNINAFGVDYQTGILVQINGSPFTTGFTRETTLVPSPDGKNLYVLSGPEDSKVEQFSVGTDGKLYGAHTYSIGGSAGATYPTAMAVDTSGKFLYITFTYQPGFTPASPGPGGVSVFPINSDGSLGTNVSFNGQPYLGVGNKPVGIAITPPICSPTPVISGNTTCTGTNGSGAENVFVYIVDQEASPNGTVLGYAQNTSTGALTPLTGTSFNSSLSTWYGYKAGVTPSAIAADPTGRYVYVTDQTSNEIIGYTINNGSAQISGNLAPMTSSPFGTGQYPVALVIDPRGKYIYTANFNSSNVSGFAIDPGSGSLSSVATGSFQVGTHPNCLTIDPALGTYIYSSNYLDNSVSAGTLNANTGALNGVPDSPFTVSQLPACIASVPNGPHAFQLANP
jgi:6-phosphogluconolactonase (cycloisomerase 2 family)